MQNLNFEKRNRNSSTQSNFTFGPSKSSHLATTNPLQHLNQENPSSPRFLNHNNIRSFDILHSIQDPSREARSLLDKLDHAPYSCFKYFILIICLIECLEIFIMLVDWLSGINGLQRFFSLFLQSWKAYSLALEYRSIELKSLKHAERAVLMMQIYMILFALEIGGNWSDGYSQEFLNSTHIPMTEIFFIVMLTIIFLEAIFYILYLFGAIKVKNILSKVSLLQGENDESNVPLVDYMINP